MEEPAVSRVREGGPVPLAQACFASQRTLRPRRGHHVPVDQLDKTKPKLHAKGGLFRCLAPEALFREQCVYRHLIPRQNIDYHHTRHKGVLASVGRASLSKTRGSWFESLQPLPILTTY